MDINKTLLNILKEDTSPVVGPTLTKPVTDPKEYTQETEKQTPPTPHTSTDETQKALGTSDSEEVANKVKKIEVGKQTPPPAGPTESFEQIMKRLEESIVEDSAPKKKKKDNEEDEDDDVNESADGKAPVVAEDATPTEISEDDPEVTSEDGDEDLTEDIEAIFAGAKLTEAAKNKAATVFKAALARKNKKDRKKFAGLASKKLNDAYGKLKESVEAGRSQFETEANKRIEEAVKYTSEKWLEENRLAVEQGIRTQIAESFITGLKNLFAEHYIEIPEGKVDVVKTLGKKVTTLESKLNETLDTNIKLRSRVDGFLKEETIRTASAGLTDTQRDKLTKLSEDVSYNSIQEFTEKLTALKESYFRRPGSEKETGPLMEQTITQHPTMSAEMERYVKALDKSKTQ